jgi:hypothetical protein
MATRLPLDQMSVAEKLGEMEAIWDDLCRRDGMTASPKWHGDVLANRERLVAEGKAKFSDWDEARRRIAARCDEDTDS